MAVEPAVLRPGPWSARADRSIVAVAGAAVVAGHVLLAARPAAAVWLPVLAAFLFFPPVVRLAFLGAVIVGPTVNPVLFGFGPAGGGTVAGGRLYALQALMVLVIVGAMVVAARNGMGPLAAEVVGLAFLLVALLTLGRPDAGLAWGYRSLQLFLVAFAVRALWHHRNDRRLLLSLAWGSAAGCTLASVHALLPSIDPFALSRPDNLPYLSVIGSFERASGAFTYPNNLGTFAAYAALLGAAAWLLGRPALPRKLAVVLMASGTSALLLSGSRAAGLGLACGILYLTFRAAPRRRALLLFAELVVALTMVIVVLSSPSALEVAHERLGTAGGTSLSLRTEGWRASLDAFQSSPLIGTGGTDARTDGFWLLYLSQGGILGAVLLLRLARSSLRPGRQPKAYPELWAALLIALCASGLLQDSLGQTLTTWFLGALLGLCALTRAPAQTSSNTGG